MKSSWWKLFNQAIYIYSISCRVESSCWVELLSQASQLNLSSWVQLLNSTQHFFKKISTQLNTFWVEYLTWTQVLHLTRSVYFYSKNKIFAKCNYKIYNKKLLIIIYYLKHWHFELKCMNILIKIFINYLNLKYLMIIKELIRQQVKWAEKLSEYNFKIIYQSRKQNLKVDVLIRMSDIKSVEANDDHKLYQHQMLLSKDRFKLQLIKDDQKVDQDLI